MEKFNIPLHGPSLNIVRRCGPALRDVLQSKFGCEATIEGVDFESDASVGQLRRPPVDPVKKFSFMLRGRVELSVWKADLTNFKVDAVVNAANEFLKHGGGLAYALSIAGGSQIQKESDDYINKHGQLGTGDAIALNAGCLPCKKIIHAVGPCLPKHPSSTEVSGVKRKLEMAIESILHQVEIHRLQSVAIPAISSGLFNFPLPECADIIVETVNRYYQSSQSSRSHVPREIRLANHDDITVSEMERACLQLLSSSSSSSSSKGATRTQTPEVQIGKVHLTLKKGQIEDQLTDVIVNTTSPERDLTIGEVSKALLLKAGYEMQKEIYNVSSTGRLLITNSYYLKCKKVFHTVCQAKGTFRQNATPKQVLGDSVTQCLQNAAKNRYKSIAFPAIGTGNLGFDKKEVAAIMAKAVFDFAHNCQTEIDVMFIIYPTDDQTYKAFEEQMVTLQQRAPRPQETGAMMSSPPEYEHRNDSHSSRAPTPQITLGGPSEETIREAGRWLSDYLHKSYSHVNISNNFIQHFGEREHLQLSRLMKKGVVIEEIFKGGHARISVTGNSSEDVVVAGFQVEAMLCNVQEEFVRDEEDAMCEALGEKRVDFERKKVDYPGNEFSDRFSAFKKEGLRTVKVDKVVNPSLKRILDLKATQLRCSTQKMFQLIPAQFCEMVCKIGFHAEYAPPGEAAYGEGIYFAGTVKKAMEVWKEQKEHQKEEYLYFVEAEVLTGISIPGTPGLILPPPVWEDPLLLHDSVSGGPDVSVIFSGYQAVPTYIITCWRD